MAANLHVKREQLLDGARAAAKASGKPFLDPQVLFGRASDDDLKHYTAEMLGLCAIHSAHELAAWDKAAPRVRLDTLAGVAPEGTAVSILSITGHNLSFLYESVMGEVTSLHRDLFMAVHPILSLIEGETPRQEAPEDLPVQDPRVSHVQVHLRALNEAQGQALVERVTYVLDQVRLAVGDWKPMLRKLQSVIDEIAGQDAGRRKAEKDEALAFLNWLKNDNFTFLGMRDYIYSGGEDAKVERDAGSGLGILSNPDVRVLRRGKDAVTTTPEIVAFLEGPDFLIVTKANAKSVVHRRAYLDYVGVKRFDASGRVTGELRIVGLFTSIAYTAPTVEIPLLRTKVARVKQHFGFDPMSHSGRMLANTLESYPRDDLFQIDSALLARFAEQINDLAERPRLRVLTRIDRFDRFVSVIVYVPREDYDSVIREKMGQYLKTVFEGRVSAYYPAFPEGGLARVHFIIGRSEGKTPRVPQQTLEAAIRQITQRWASRFAELAGADAPRVEVSQAFEDSFAPEEAVRDLGNVTACAEGSEICIDFHERVEAGQPRLCLKIFHAGGELALSRRVPLLENLGFDVISERTFDLFVSPEGSEPKLVVLHDMDLEPLKGKETFRLAPVKPALEEAFLAAFSGDIDNDGFNKLVLSGLTARQINVLRAYARYLRQAGTAYSQDYIAATLDRYAEISRMLFQLFSDAFDPAMSEDTRLKQQEELHRRLEESLAAVPSIDDDRILRRYINLIDATLRTNYFQPQSAPDRRKMLAFKLDPSAIDGLPSPRPFREIFVYGVEVEGVHLRFGKVARGGLRWSDRAEDYRTEVLGLVKAQQVKNAVIVPVGAKGGFLPKRLPPGGSRDAVFEAGREAYRVYIRSLLSLTDNIIGSEVVPPEATVRQDDDDPYFVVAADKGTATFSDTANGLAQEAGFWLDDAFASGGSAGYDHKKMGITARGAWETVKRHFRELDVDIQTTPFTVVGVGDMSGDVFGNGMLLSEKIRLIAAFDHRDIFIDPDPDMAKSHAERKRLFDLPRSSWQDYDKSLLSPGGMIVSRSAKTVTLTPEATAAIGLSKSTATPFEIIAAILRSDVDLLWFGGIGTYVKANSESDADVGDKANDAVRITADEVRAKVIGEGANLGVTQKARIAYSLRGGRCNSDAIDNSAGVNTSDVEVNIKIAFAAAMQSGRLTREARDRLLGSMTEEVAALVLRNNYLQSLAISLTERRKKRNGLELARLMTVLEGNRQFSRKLETLPDDATMTERYASDRPLTRPEIGVLLSHAKIVLFDALLDSALPDDPYFEAVLFDYFPAKMRKVQAEDIRHHRLRREIVATRLANETINRGGPAFVVGLMDATAATASDVVKAAVIASDAFGLARLWDEVDRLDNRLPGERQNGLYAEIGLVFAVLTRVILRTKLMAGDLSETIDRLSAAAAELRPIFAKRLSNDIAARAEAETVLSPTLNEALVLLQVLPVIPEILLICERTGRSLAATAEAYGDVTRTCGIDRLLRMGASLASTDHYESLALSRSLDQIAAARRDIVMAALLRHGEAETPVQEWHASDRTRINHILQELTQLSDSGDANLAKLAVAAGLLGDLARGDAA